MATGLCTECEYPLVEYLYWIEVGAPAREYNGCGMHRRRLSFGGVETDSYLCLTDILCEPWPHSSTLETLSRGR